MEVLPISGLDAPHSGCLAAADVSLRCAEIAAAAGAGDRQIGLAYCTILQLRDFPFPPGLCRRYPVMGTKPDPSTMSEMPDERCAA
jgi:hypothetical protein